MEITKYHIGHRLLVKKSSSILEDVIELIVLEFSPNEKFIKVEIIRSDKTRVFLWEENKEFSVLDDLGVPLIRNSYVPPKDNLPEISFADTPFKFLSSTTFTC